MRPLPLTSTGTGGSGLSLVPSSHLLQPSHVGPPTEPVTPPPPQVSHSNLSQVARAHPYAAAPSAAPLPSNSSSALGRYSSGQSMPSTSGIYSSSPTYSRADTTAFPLRSPPDRSGEYRRRLTLLPHSGLSPLDYASSAAALSGPGPGGGSSSSQAFSRHHQLSGMHPQYSTAHLDHYREPLMMASMAGAANLGESAHKKLRIGEPLLMKATLAQPLRIDTRSTTVIAPSSSSQPTAPVHRESQSAYIPQVEAISPTPGDGDDPLKRDDSPLRSVKDDLLGQISKVLRDFFIQVFAWMCTLCFSSGGP